MAGVVDVSKRQLLGWLRDNDDGTPLSQASQPGDAAAKSEALRKLKDALRDGQLLLRLLMDIFPSVREAVPRAGWEPSAANRFAVNHNWECIMRCAGQLGIPLGAFDRVGLSVGRDKAVFTVLAMLYFLQKLKAQPRFTAAFSFRLTADVQSYLQSTACVMSLARSGAVRAAGVPPEPIDLADLRIPKELVNRDWLWKNGAGDPTLGENAGKSRGRPAWPRPGFEPVAEPIVASATRSSTAHATSTSPPPRRKERAHSLRGRSNHSPRAANPGKLAPAEEPGVPVRRCVVAT